MAIWERFSTENTLSTAATHTNNLLLHNQEDTDNFQNADIVLVDGILTVITDTDDLCGVRLILMHELIEDDANLDEGNPQPDSRQVWYTFFCARGPLVFRLRSKKTLWPQHKLYLQAWKEKGGTSTTIRCGILLLEQLKH